MSLFLFFLITLFLYFCGSVLWSALANETPHQIAKVLGIETRRLVKLNKHIKGLTAHAKVGSLAVSPSLSLPRPPALPPPLELCLGRSFLWGMAVTSDAQRPPASDNWPLPCHPAAPRGL